MKYTRFLILTVAVLSLVNPKNISACILPITICDSTTLPFITMGGVIMDVWVSCAVPVGSTGPIINFSSTTPFSVKAYGRYITGDPCAISVGSACDSFILATSLTINSLHGSGAGEYYYFHILPNSSTGSVTAVYLVSPNPCYADTTALPCSDCIPSFNPQRDSSYIISAWVKDANASVNTTTYVHGSISISYMGTTHTRGPLHPKGQIIDGWQLLEDTFKVPQSAEKISINLNAGTTSYFDDIRVFPYKGSMKSYVFDPLTLRLVAELDERNYATMYEYDEEGKLVRVKKETERGIMTIQEIKSNMSK
jgi:hypothetical protein